MSKIAKANMAADISQMGSHAIRRNRIQMASAAPC
jgi:hypothetical protein